MDVPHELASVRGELGRADTKAATLLGIAGTAASVGAAAAALGTPHLPSPAQYTLWAAVILLVAGVAVLLYAVRPSLPRRGEGAGWVVYAHATPDLLADRPAVEYERDRIAELVVLSRLARTKHRVIQIAVDLLLGALAVSLVSTVLIVRGGA